MTVFGNLPTTLAQIGGFDEMAIGITDTTDSAVISTTVSLPVFSDHHKGQIVFVMDYSSSMDEYVGGRKKY